LYVLNTTVAIRKNDYFEEDSNVKT
jgi:hypothetical protein